MMRMILCALSAMIGAGFASGREIMQFFSRFGVFSWPLIALCAFIMGTWMDDLMAGPRGIFGKHTNLFLLLLYAGTAGAMTAAAGELTALTLPVRFARMIGMAATLLACLFLSQRSMTALYRLGQVLVPMILLCWVLCGVNNPPSKMVLPPQRAALYTSGCLALCYGALNVMLAAGVLQDAGKRCTPPQREKAAWVSAAALGLMLMGANAVLMRCGGHLVDHPLPMVALMARQGRGGYFLSAAVLYLAVVTTLIAVLRNIDGILASFRLKHPLLLSGLITLCVALLGFGDIVGVCYPLLGALCALLLAIKKRKPQ